MAEKVTKSEESVSHHAVDGKERNWEGWRAGMKWGAAQFPY